MSEKTNDEPTILDFVGLTRDGRVWARQSLNDGFGQPIGRIEIRPLVDEPAGPIGGPNFEAVVKAVAERLTASATAGAAAPNLCGTSTDSGSMTDRRNIETVLTGFDGPRANGSFRAGRLVVEPGEEPNAWFYNTGFTVELTREHARVKTVDSSVDVAELLRRNRESQKTARNTVVTGGDGWEIELGDHEPRLRLSTGETFDLVTFAEAAKMAVEASKLATRCIQVKPPSPEQLDRLMRLAAETRSVVIEIDDVATVTIGGRATAEQVELEHMRAVASMNPAQRTAMILEARMAVKAMVFGGTIPAEERARADVFRREAAIRNREAEQAALESSLGHGAEFAKVG